MLEPNRGQIMSNCVYLQHRKEGELGQRPLPGELLRAKAGGVIMWIFLLQESSGPAVRGRVMRAGPMWRCLFGGQQEVSN